MTTVSQLYPSPWLKADDLVGSVAVKIAKVTVEEIRQPDGEKTPRIVLSFSKDGKPTKKRLICNKTQALRIAELTRTEEFNRWVGLEVILQPAKATNGKPTIAITAARPAQATPPKVAQSDPKEEEEEEDNPFKG